MKTIAIARLLICLLLLFPVCLLAIDITGAISSGGRTRSFVLHAPGAAVAQNLPVVLVFHGDGGTGAGIKSYAGFDAVADTANFIAVYPNADTEGWNRAVDQLKDAQFVSDLIDYLCSTYYINRQKVYATGHSAGGYMTYNLAINQAKKIAAFAPVAGNMYASSGSYSYAAYFASANYTPVAIYHVHGDPDGTVAYIDPDHAPTAWGEWPLTQFSYYNCAKTTYTLPNTTIATNVTKLRFCGSGVTTGKEISLVRVQGVGHGWPVVAVFNPAVNIWRFFRDYSISGLPGCAPAPPANMGAIRTSGKQIRSACDSAFLPKGINYSLLDDWDFPANINNGNELSAQIIKANPNTVRIQWYNDYGQASRPAYSLAHLDTVVSRFRRAGIVSVIELHDLTGKNDSALFQNRIVNWWKSPAVLALLQKHKSHVMVNLANEYGPLMYPPPSYTLDANYASKINAWASLMQSAIVQLRTAGIVVPIMIDAPNYGRDITSLLAKGSAWNAADPLHSIILSAHAYWEGETAAQVDAKVQQVAASPLPVILGEIANVGEPCTATIALNDVLQSCQTRGVGWLAWTWYKDYCSARQLSTNGLFTSLSAYGQTVVNNTIFGLAATAKKMDTSCNAICLPPTLPVIAVSPSATICAGTAVTLSIASGNLNSAIAWKWYSGSCGAVSVGTGSSITVSPTATTTYYVRGEGACVAAGVCAQQTITVTPRLVPAVSVVAASNTICAGTKIVFTATATSGGSSPAYQWKKNNANVGGNTATYTDSLLSNNDSVWVVLTSNAGCVTTATAVSNKVKMVVNAKPVAGFTVSNATQCANANFFSFTNSSTGASSYSWQLGNGTVSTSTNASAAYSNAGVYAVKLLAVSNNGCKDSITQNITVLASPVLGPDIVRNKCAGSLFNLTTLYNSPGISYAWNNANPAAVDTGVYTVIASAGNGCRDTAVVTIANYPYAVPVYTINNAIAGSYTLVGTNQYGCKDSATIVISSIDCPAPVAMRSVATQSATGKLFTIQPNPASTVVYIDGAGLKDVQMTSSEGKRITGRWSNNPKTQRNSVNLSGLSKGLYMLQLTDSNGTVQVEKLIVQ